MDERGTRGGAGTIEGDTVRITVVGAPVPRRRRGRRIAAVLGAVVLLLVLVVAGTVYALSESLGNNVDRVPGAFAGLDESTRPVASDAVTFLLVGTDTRSDAPTTGEDAGGGVGGDRSDVLMLARVDPSRESASVVSIPRDSWVDIPGYGMNKANAAYAFGGPSLLIETVENLTQIRVDHFGVIDFAGFESMIDAVGGIDVSISEATSNDGVEFRQGLNHLDGASALAFVRQRYDLADGDLDRAQRQQAVLRALLSKAASGSTFSNPAAFYTLLDAATRSVGVDDTLSNGGLRSLALEMTGLRPSAVTFVRAPVAGLGREGDQSVVYLNQHQSALLWKSVDDGRIVEYIGRHPADALGAVTR
ncbi:LCP family protein [Pseudonocardia sp. KRD-184]|uniref:LCP family protein n=1 Tax=Pseudonocardia oceani TaxID=2792013 RepID=A0ABS6U5I4_9PSEU|nr:LCP family protein [Pseudonocardia oceani]MBW0098420.1 LCP family protein [Pseudonocardia oceani]MBW0124999.1 LCP family protein [Pseudonocardia oceani]MBW0127494.1 LCP family protein [Pseudonocardia oceani]